MVTTLVHSRIISSPRETEEEEEKKKKMSRSSRLSSILNRRENLRPDDFETDSSLSDMEVKNRSLNECETSSNDENSPSTCCLICSILPNLSSINTCQKHLNLLRTSRTPTQVVYMMHPGMNICHCKHRCRSISSSSSSDSKFRRKKKKRSMTIQSSNSSSPSEIFFSPNTQPQANRSDHVEARLSPSLPPSSIINTTKHYPELLLSPLLQRNSTEIPNTSSPDVLEIDCELPSSSPPTQIVHVKDENESFSDTDQNQTTLNMSEATEQMFYHEYPQPIILLQRVCLEK